ncbi:hypothetical protein [Mycolicibacterium lutetiense]|uniref:Transmembrane protein n=1 Tax=Mycolicibacterium lutetiense TaxID=1641992 RepID=A0ABS4ZP50_9MYCO|nr:hypothetical protein [Mycolicibacterium lutetiense]MBP2450956.1 hypothetical protein [Mycolicibacterium lutetiense]
MAAPTRLPTRTDIDQWTEAISDLTTASADYRRCASSLETIADAHCQMLSSPGGTDWTGDGGDAAREAAYRDRGIVWQATDHLRNNLARVADQGAQDINAARNRVQEAIDLAEQDGFTVGDDLSVSDTDTYTTMAEYTTRQTKAAEHSQDIARQASGLVDEDAHAGQKLSVEAAALDAVAPASWGAGGIPTDGSTPGFNPVDHEVGDPQTEPPHPVQQGAPPNRFVGDSRFGHWSPVPLTHDGSSPPLKSEYRPLDVSDDPTKLAGTTGMYTPGKNWIQDSSAPYAQYKEEYRFRIAGQEATTHTRMVNDNGTWRQERWVQNVYEYQQNKQFVAGGDVRVKGKDGSLGGLPPVTLYDNDWKRIAPQEIVSLSANNSAVKYYLPDGCGGQFTIEKGVPVGGYSGMPPVSLTPTPGSGEVPPIMQRPR